MPIDRYPLCWPTGWKRTPASSRARAKFHKQKQNLSVSQGTNRVLYELARLGVYATKAIISTNVQIRQDGLPYSNCAEPSDSGVAVYWTKSKYLGGKFVDEHRVMAIDQYDRTADNLAAIAATLEAMRQIERHGGATILDRAFTGFEALPAPTNWREALLMPTTPYQPKHEELIIARQSFLRLVKLNHPDIGGSHERMAEINQAWEDAQKELS